MNRTVHHAVLDMQERYGHFPRPTFEATTSTNFKALLDYEAVSSPSAPLELAVFVGKLINTRHLVKSAKRGNQCRVQESKNL